MLEQHTENIDIQYSTSELFEKNHIKSTKILEKIRLGNFSEVLAGIGHVKDRSIVIDIKYFKYFANQHTYEIIINHLDHIISQLLSTNSTYSIYVNLQSMSLTDIDKHYLFCKSAAVFFSQKYPDRLHKCYVYNASVFFESLLNIISNFVDKITLKKILLIKE
jgi:hypothetical protein